MIVLCIFLFLCDNVVYGQFPRACITEEALQAKRCCPVWQDGSPCGIKSGRGKCQNRVVPVTFLFSDRAEPVMQNNDDRIDWPKFYYNSTCECSGNYSGYNCGECKFGCGGDNCDRKQTVKRREISELTKQERITFFGYLCLLKATISEEYVVLTTGNRHHRNAYRFENASLYDIYVWMHNYASQPLLQAGNFRSVTFAHQGPAFLTWHRCLLLFLERQIQKFTGDENFGLPYYDWRGEKNCSVCKDDILGANNEQGSLSKNSYFASWKSMCSGYPYADAYCLSAVDANQREILHRKPGGDPAVTRFPSVQDVNNVLRMPYYDTTPFNANARMSFRNTVEGFMNSSDGTTPALDMHNLIHVYFGGTMSEVPISTNDPVFALHHAFIDKIFNKWLQVNETRNVYPANTRPGQGPLDCAIPFVPCQLNKDFLQKSSVFGYTYSEYNNF